MSKFFKGSTRSYCLLFVGILVGVVLGVLIGKAVFPASATTEDSVPTEELLHAERYPVIGVNFELHNAYTDRTLIEFDPRNYCLLLTVNTAAEGEEEKLEYVHTSLDKVKVTLAEEGTVPESTLNVGDYSLIVANGNDFSYACTEENFEGFDETMIRFCLAYLFYTDEQINDFIAPDYEVSSSSDVQSESVSSDSNG